MSTEGEAALETGDRRSSLLVYRVARFVIRWVIAPYLRVVTQGALPAEGPVIVAPVHRSHLDSAMIALVTERRVRALGKASLFRIPIVRWIVAALGAVPVERGTADRDAIRLSELILDRGEPCLVFPEGTRRTGPVVSDVYDGVAFLASRTDAAIVPIGIAGTDEAMPPGARFPRRGHVNVVVGEPVPAPISEGSRVPRSELRRASDALHERLQWAMDAAQRDRDDRMAAARS